MKYHFWGSLEDDLWLKPSNPKRSDIIVQTKAVKKRSLQDLIAHWLFTLFFCNISIQSDCGKIENPDIQQWRLKFWWIEGFISSIEHLHLPLTLKATLARGRGFLFFSLGPFSCLFWQKQLILHVLMNIWCFITRLTAEFSLTTE